MWSGRATGCGERYRCRRRCRPRTPCSPLLEIQLADKCLHQRATRRALGRTPVTATRKREETLLVEILFEHVEPFGEERKRAVAIRRLLEERHHQRCIAEGDRGERERDGRAGRIFRRDPDGGERLCGFGAAGDGQGTET